MIIIKTLITTIIPYFLAKINLKRTAKYDMMMLQCQAVRHKL